MLCDKRKDELEELTRDLVAQQSESGSEDGAAGVLKQYMLRHGFDEVTTDDSGSVIGRLSGSRPGPKVLFDGHLDTVPVANPAAWTHDPYGCEIVDGRMYGRGTSDMKGAVAAFTAAARFFSQDRNRDFGGEIYIAGTVHEECFEGVAARSVSQTVHPDYVVIGEASLCDLKIGQRGRAEIVVETFGTPAHSANPDKGVNAVYAMCKVVEAIRQLPCPEHPVLGKGILELTDIKSSPYPGASVVPSLCRATFDRRTLAGEDEAVILGQVEQAIARARERIPGLEARAFLAEGREACWTGETISAKRYFPAWVVEEDSELVQKALADLREAGIEAPISHFAFCTNGSHFCGEAGIPAIGYGPSLESLAHVRDEYIEIEQLTKACRGFESILRQLTR